MHSTPTTRSSVHCGPRPAPHAAAPRATDQAVPPHPAGPPTSLGHSPGPYPPAPRPCAPSASTPHPPTRPTPPRSTAPHPPAPHSPAPHPPAPRPAVAHPGRRPAAGTAPPRRADPRRPAVRPRPAARPLPPHLWFAERLLDVLTGRRPLTSLAGRVRDEAYQRLWELHAERADWRQRARGRTPRVCRCRTFRTASGALEVTAVVALDDGVIRAIAFRLEPGDADSGAGYGRARWRCTAVAAR